MIAEIFAYCAVVALLVGFAAASFERFLAELERPRRFAWSGAYVVALAFPVASLWWGADAPVPLPVPLDTAPDGPVFEWDAVLMWLWGGVTALLLLAYGAAWVRLAWLARRWPRVQSGEASVLVADDVGPAVLGIRAPSVILPGWLMDAPAPVRKTVIAHELEHIAARDQASLVAAHLVAILLPWNLPLWWFAKRLRAAIEIDCDARVLRNGVDPEHYADVLLAVGQRGASSPFAAAALVEPVTQLERRIRIMLRRRPRSITHAVTAAILTTAVAACATQIEPPVPTTGSSPPGTVAAPPPRITAEGAARIIVDDSGTGDITLHAPRIVMTLADSGEMRATSERMIVNESDGSLSFEGNVRFDFDHTSITASRALAKRASDGSTVVEIDDAKVVRLGADVRPSSE